MVHKRKTILNIGILTHIYPASSNDRKDAGMFVHDFCNELSKNADVFVFCPDFGGKKEKYKKVPVTWMDWGGPKTKFGTWTMFSPISVFNFFKLIIVGSREAVKFASENKVDYVLACWTIPSSIYALYINRKLKIPYSVWILGSDVNIYGKLPILRQLTILALRRARKRFSNSYWLINATQKLCGKECDYMDAMTDFDVSRVHPKKLEKNVFNFLFAGSIRPVKGVDILVKAAFELRKVTSDFVIHILGDGPMKVELEQYVSKNNLNENVIFYGVVGKDVVASFMKSVDSLVVSSRMESIPLVIIEAARVGLPTISTDVGDDKRVINEFGIGLICKREDPVDMARVMHKAIKQGNEFKSSRKVGLRKLAKSRSQKKTVETFLKEVRTI